MAFVDRARKGELVVEGDGVGGAGGYSAALLQKGRTSFAIPSKWCSIDMILS